jgi:flavin reductase (DIM6/NTAB) family NADH-FMN oxidoreductase RutF
MHFDLAQLAPSDAYKLLVSTVVPRPIALATTVDSAGQVNAAPFSFFNAVSSIPPVVVLGISPGDSAGDGWKDTERNIRETGEFVVNLVDEAIAERMNVCDVPFPTGVNELEMAELHPAALNASALPGCRSGPGRRLKSAASSISTSATISSIPRNSTSTATRCA